MNFAADHLLLLNPNYVDNAPYNAAQAQILSDEAFADARRTIRAWPGYQPSPLFALDEVARECDVAAVHYKDEGGRFGLGSFKALGGAYAVARQLARVASEARGSKVEAAEIADGHHRDAVAGVTVCCATDGNHGRSVAWGASQFGCRAVIFIHATVSDARQRAIESFGASVVRVEGNYDDSVAEAQRQADANGWIVVSDTSYPGYTDIPKDVMQGYEIMVDETLASRERPPTHVFLQTGVGGMAAAVAAYFIRNVTPRPSFVLADPAESACWYESLRAGKPTAVEGELDTIMAGLACGEVSLLAWTILQNNARAVVVLKDDAAIECMRRLARPKTDPVIVAGESAVGGLAALLAVAAEPVDRAALGLSRDSRILVFGTEADTDAELYEQLVGVSGSALRATAR